MSDLEAFIQFCCYVIPIVILLTSFLWGLLSHIKYRNHRIGTELKVILSYLFCFGVILHEVAHQCFCYLFGVQVRDVRYFFVQRFSPSRESNKSSVTSPAPMSEFCSGEQGYQPPKGEVINIGGYVKILPPQSPLIAFFIATAPLFINGLFVALLLFYYPLIVQTPYYPLAIYLIIALALGVEPSKTDFLSFFYTFRVNCGRGFIEFLSLFLILGGLAIIAQYLPIWGILLIWGFILIIIMISCRRHTAKGRTPARMRGR